MLDTLITTGLKALKGLFNEKNPGTSIINQPYKLYFDDMLFPITPSKITYSYENKNKVLELIDGRDFIEINNNLDFNIDFELRIPIGLQEGGLYDENNKYSPNSFLSYSNRLGYLKQSGTPFTFYLERESYVPFKSSQFNDWFKTTGKSFLGINYWRGTFQLNGQNFCKIRSWVKTKVILNEMEWVEDQSNGGDFIVKISLKKYNEQQTKTYVLNEEDGSITIDAKTYNRRTPPVDDNDPIAVYSNGSYSPKELSKHNKAVKQLISLGKVKYIKETKNVPVGLDWDKQKIIYSKSEKIYPK